MVTRSPVADVGTTVPTASAERMAWMDTLRGVAVVLVVLLHAGEGLRHYASSLPGPIDDLNQLFEPYRMPTLAFLSGMLLQRSLAKGPARYLKGKAARVAWPYVLWSLIVVALSSGPTLGEVARIVYYPPTYLWYLYFLLIYYVVALALRRVPPLVLVAAGLVGAATLPATWRLDKLSFLMAMFFLGDWVVRNPRVWRPWVQKNWLLGVCCVLVVTGSVLDAREHTVLYQTWAVWAVLAWLVVAIRLIPTLPVGRVVRTANAVGRSSLIYYVAHLVPLKILGTLLQRQGFDDPWVMYPLLVATGFLAPTALVLLSRRFRLAAWLFAFPDRAERAALRSALRGRRRGVRTAPRRLRPGLAPVENAAEPARAAT